MSIPNIPTLSELYGTKITFPLGANTPPRNESFPWPCAGPLV